MNESTLTLLKILVERTVRPVRASTLRKRKMREELLAHVSDVFDEEWTRLHDDRAALERTALRFGDPVEITSQLQEAVPTNDGLVRFAEGRPGESPSRGALRLAGVAGATSLVLGVAATVCFACGWVSTWSLQLLVAFNAGVAVFPLWLLSVALVTRWLERSLRGPLPITGWPHIGLKSMITAAWAAPAVRLALITGGLCLLLNLGLALANGGPDVEAWPGSSQLVFVVFIVGGVGAYSVLAAWVLVQSADARRRYHDEWARLPVD